MPLVASLGVCLVVVGFMSWRFEPGMFPLMLAVLNGTVSIRGDIPNLSLLILP